MGENLGLENPPSAQCLLPSEGMGWEEPRSRRCTRTGERLAKKKMGYKSNSFKNSTVMNLKCY
ncbi:MAG: hypothetical protein D6707_11210 [Bacteroidetes bacterium]|nr:MAG: hypothetical protein D6707_11210 [Bacteroidota bacterium]